MDAERVINDLRAEYPGRNIVARPPTDPSEIICEVDPSLQRSVAVTVVELTKPHYHMEASETYEVLEGPLTLVVSAKSIHMETGDVYTIPPGHVHSAIGESAKVRVTSTPGWTQEDHTPYGGNE